MTQLVKFLAEVKQLEENIVLHTVCVGGGGGDHVTSPFQIIG